MVETTNPSMIINIYMSITLALMIVLSLCGCNKEMTTPERLAEEANQLPILRSFKPAFQKWMRLIPYPVPKCEKLVEMRPAMQRLEPYIHRIMGDISDGHRFLSQFFVAASETLSKHGSANDNTVFHMAVKQAGLSKPPSTLIDIQMHDLASMIFFAIATGLSTEDMAPIVRNIEPIVQALISGARLYLKNDESISLFNSAVD